MNRGALELRWSFELTMLASLGAEVLVLARCAVGGGCGASGWRSCGLGASMAGAATTPLPRVGAMNICFIEEVYLGPCAAADIKNFVRVF